MQMYDFIAVGETDTDIFIRLEDESGAQVMGTPDTADYRISLPFAQKIAYQSATTVSGVGNAPNAAVSAAKLGLKSALFAHVGDDEGGRETIDSLEQHGVDTTFVTPEPGKKTSHSYIIWYKQDRTILRKHEDFSYAKPDLSSPKWVYFSAMGSKVDNFYDDFAAYIEAHPEVHFAFQPGGNEIKLGIKLARFYKRADIFFCNVEEAGAILGVETLGIKELLKRVHEQGPKMVVITDGPKGAYAYDGTIMWFVPIYPDGLTAYERTGAGDAFASTTTVALALGEDLSTALLWGAVNSASVVQKIGAQEGLLSQAEIKERLAAAPDFKASTL